MEQIPRKQVTEKQLCQEHLSLQNVCLNMQRYFSRSATRGKAHGSFHLHV